MSLTRDRLQQLHADRWRRVRLGGPGRRPPTGAWLTERGVVGRVWPRRLGLAWVVVLAVAMALEPAPADPDAAEPLWAGLLFLGLVGALAATWTGLARRQRLGLVASVAAAGVALVGAVSCPLTDHHASVGAWWYLQLAGFTGLAGAGLAGLRRARSSA